MVSVGYGLPSVTSVILINSRLICPLVVPVRISGLQYRQYKQYKCPHNMSNKKANENNISVRKDMRVEKELLAIIDSVRGDVSYSAWVRRACVQRLTSEGIAVPSDNELPTPQAAVMVKKPSKILNKPKPRYMWHTPQGSFDNRGDAVRASGIKADSLTKKCDAKIDGFSRDLV